MTLDAHVPGIWCGQIGGCVGNFGNPPLFLSGTQDHPKPQTIMSLSLQPKLSYFLKLDVIRGP